MAFSPPEGWPLISSSLVYENPRKGIDFLCKAFGFKIGLLVEGEDGSVVHSQIVIGDSLVMVGSEKAERRWCKSPRAVGGANTQSLMIFVEDVDAHFAHAKENGAKIVTSPKVSDYGDEYWCDKSYECEDIDGHHWYFVQRMRGPKKN